MESVWGETLQYKECFTKLNTVIGNQKFEESLMRKITDIYLSKTYNQIQQNPCTHYKIIKIYFIL